MEKLALGNIFSLQTLSYVNRNENKQLDSIVRHWSCRTAADKVSIYVSRGFSAAFLKRHSSEKCERSSEESSLLQLPLSEHCRLSANCFRDGSFIQDDVSRHLSHTRNCNCDQSGESLAPRLLMSFSAEIIAWIGVNEIAAVMIDRSFFFLY